MQDVCENFSSFFYILNEMFLLPYFFYFTDLITSQSVILKPI